MSPRLKKPCAAPGCPTLIDHGTAYCDGHQNKAWKPYDRQRGTSTERGYDARWRKVRDAKLRRDPLCERCEDLGRTRAADLVHHIVPVEQAPHLRLADSNLQSLCVPCHQQIHAEMERTKGDGHAA